MEAAGIEPDSTLVFSVTYLNTISLNWLEALKSSFGSTYWVRGRIQRFTTSRPSQADLEAEKSSGISRRHKS